MLLCLCVCAPRRAGRLCVWYEVDAERRRDNVQPTVSLSASAPASVASAAASAAAAADDDDDADYFQQNTRQQLWAANALKAAGWRMHTNVRQDQLSWGEVLYASTGSQLGREREGAGLRCCAQKVTPLPAPLHHALPSLLPQFQAWFARQSQPRVVTETHETGPLVYFDANLHDVTPPQPPSLMLMQPQQQEKIYSGWCPRVRCADDRGSALRCRHPWWNDGDVTLPGCQFTPCPACLAWPAADPTSASSTRCVVAVLGGGWWVVGGVGIGLGLGGQDPVLPALQRLTRVYARGPTKGGADLHHFTCTLTSCCHPLLSLKFMETEDTTAESDP